MLIVMSNDMHCAGGQDYYENQVKNPEEEKRKKDLAKKSKIEEYFYENGVKYKLAFDSEIRAWVKEVVSENKKEK